MDWNQIKTEYVAGGTSYRRLAEKYGVPFGTLKRIAIRDQWRALREQAEKNADTKIANAVGKKKAKVAEKIYDVADLLLDRLKQSIEKRDTIDSQTMKHYTSALKDLRDIKGVKNELDIREQEVRIANLEKQAKDESGKPAAIEVVFDAGPEEWNE